MVTEIQSKFDTALWLRKAHDIPIRLHATHDRQAYAVTPVRSARTWQGWRMTAADSGWREEARQRGSVLFLDFGSHGVGTVTLEVTPYGAWSYDAPLRLRLLFGEQPAEVAEADVPYQGGLSQSWIQEEIINIDQLPAQLTLPRRYAFRYLRLECLAFSGSFKWHNVTARTVTSADRRLQLPSPDIPDVELAAIDRIGIATLKSCMQHVLEDGPKRDRRLWLGDLKLQALVNAVSFRNFDLIERCLYLLAAALDEEGLVPGCVFDRNVAPRGCDAVDYALLLGPTLLDHLKLSGREECPRELFELALHQLSLVRELFDAAGRLPDEPRWWVFVDHVKKLDRSAAFMAIYIYSLRQHAELAGLLGLPDVATTLELEAAARSQQAREFFYDAARGMVHSGVARQLSYASQIWFVLAGILDPDESRRALAAIATEADAVRPVSPYLWHYMLEALFRCGMKQEAWQIIREYWGSMVRHGADTFWEVYVPGEMKFSPYGDYRLNSACHAWSCTPSYFIRTHL